MKMQTENVTPDRAQALLANQLANRPLKEGHILRLVRAIATGNFKLSPFPVVIDHQGKLVDGQHRLTALIRCSATLPFWVCRLAEGESALDVRMQGGAQVPPSHADLLAFDRPDEKNLTVRTSIAKFAFHLDSDLKPNVSIGYHEIRDLMDQYKAELDWVVDITMKAPLRRLAPAAFGGTVLWATTPKLSSGDAMVPAVHQFAERYVFGEGLTAGDPELALRNAMLTRVERHVTRAAFVQKFASLFMAAQKGERRDRAQGSTVAVAEMAKVLGKTPPEWVKSKI